MKYEIIVNSKSFLLTQSISPGLVSTEIFDANNFNVDVLKDLPALKADDIANAVIYVIGTPQRVHITELIIRPFGEVQY